MRSAAPSGACRRSWMAASAWTCPSEDALYRFSTGDASRWQRVRLRRHLECCAACSELVEGWDAVTAAYRECVIDTAKIPLGFHDDGRARFDARLRRESPAPTRTLAWPRRWVRPRTIGWRSIAAAIVLVAGGLLGLLPIQQTITADALVARAVANDRQCPCPRADMVTIDASRRFRRGSAPRVRPAGASPSGNVAGSTVAGGLMSARGAHARELADRLRAYAFDWQAPLSARPYQEWRAAVTVRTESYDW